MDTKKVWLITGASKGLGLTMVKKLLDNEYRVAATSRNISALESAVGQHIDFLPLQVDLISEESVESGISKVLDTFGRIDVVVNNAGYGQNGTLEELTDEESRQNFDVNVFGMLNVIRKTMPHLRKQQSGHIFNIASIAGMVANFPGFGIYCATKFAVVGLSEALSAEAKLFGINATVVYPGYFRTEFLSDESLRLAKNKMDVYAPARESERLHKEEIAGNQPGDPKKAAEVIIEVAESKNPTLHLFLGSDSYAMAQDKLKSLETILESNKVLSHSTDFKN
ncbi:SDR family NAD(P)-dependent oxidoreductase [Flagellimonas halotolerans]|uniref:SDR family NAD(P)-dependent oxidoreductase n=1 Tax=Flagellimonas halotolerans TaxID=3112164 RepID=A0ABU6IUS3_9FLAO|nr:MULTISPECIES: SDR family NAD(P)-dependent oxidoreductase [unclassified Allomuricauda]MEC3966736.1 SDR family NAD(P)-dependent oxidoreductase [Muricauda sp. SYSU M86414]MEC4266615.1 SDR family NAD(P)-dependent oxidoreductase [Muricauda sp. SYSU M84420]